MYCQKCGQQNDSNAKFCMGCGKPLTDSDQNRISITRSPSPRASEPGRGGLILTFGILSIALLGPILGIPAWIMGHNDLKKINAGIIAISQKELTKGGMICGIVGTFISPFIIIIVGIAIAVGLSLFTANSIQANKDAMINDLNIIAANAYQYNIRPESMGGGEGSYKGYKIPSKLASNEDAKYYAQIISSTSIKFTAVSSQNTENKVIVYLSDDGILGKWTFTGDFQ